MFYRVNMATLSVSKDEGIQYQGLGGRALSSRIGNADCSAFVDSTGLCLFVAFAMLDIPEGLEGIVEMCNARYGWNKTLDDYIEMGKQVLRDEKAFNRAAGICEGADELPDFFRSEPLAPHNVVFDVSKEELAKLYNF
jgi:aldehyde:ferredoxin oxidoreductase